MIDYSCMLGFKGVHHAREGQFVVILKKIGDYLVPSILYSFLA